MRKVTLLSGATSVDFRSSLGVDRRCGNWAMAIGGVTTARARRPTATWNCGLVDEIMTGPPGKRGVFDRVRSRPRLAEELRCQFGQVATPDHPGVGPGRLLRQELHALCLHPALELAVR